MTQQGTQAHACTRLLVAFGVSWPVCTPVTTDRYPLSQWEVSPHKDERISFRALPLSYRAWIDLDNADTGGERSEEWVHLGHTGYYRNSSFISYVYDTVCTMYVTLSSFFPQLFALLILLQRLEKRSGIASASDSSSTAHLRLNTGNPAGAVHTSCPRQHSRFLTFTSLNYSSIAPIPPHSNQKAVLNYYAYIQSILEQCSNFFTKSGSLPLTLHFRCRVSTYFEGFLMIYAQTVATLVSIDPIGTTLTIPWTPQLTVDKTLNLARKGGILSCTCEIDADTCYTNTHL